MQIQCILSVLWGAFCWHGLGLLVPLEWRVTASQDKLVLSIRFILWWDISILVGVFSSRMTMPSSIGHEGSLNGLMSMKIWIICYGLCSHLISTQLNTYGRFWTDVWQPILLLHSKDTVKIIWKKGVPSSRVPKTCRINAKAHWSSSGGTWWPKRNTTSSSNSGGWKTWIRFSSADLDFLNLLFPITHRSSASFSASFAFIHYCIWPVCCIVWWSSEIQRLVGFWSWRSLVA